MKSQAMLGFALFVLFVGYIELRLPVPIDAQGRAAVYERVSVVDTVANALRVAGGATVAGAMNAGSVTTGTPIAPQYLGTGTRTGTRYLRDDGIWAGVSPPSASALLATSYRTTSSSFVSTGLSITLTVATATSDVIVSSNLLIVNGSDTHCEFALMRGATELWNTPLQFDNVLRGDGWDREMMRVSIVDQNPGVGTHAYAIHTKRIGGGNDCGLNQVRSSGRMDGPPSVIIGQVLR